MLPTKKAVEHMSGGSSPYHERINRAMGLGGLTKFLMTAETHRGGKFYAMDLAQQNDIIKIRIKRTKKEVNINMPSLSYQTINVDWQSKKEQQISQALHSVISVSYTHLTLPTNREV